MTQADYRYQAKRDGTPNEPVPSREILVCGLKYQTCLHLYEIINQQIGFFQTLVAVSCAEALIKYCKFEMLLLHSNFLWKRDEDNNCHF